MTGLTYLADTDWMPVLENLAHFRPHLAVSTLLIVFIEIALWRPSAISVALGSLVLMAGFTPALLAPIAAPVVQAEGHKISVLALNVRFSNSVHATVIGHIARNQPDVVVLSEVTSEWAAAIDQLSYPHRFIHPAQDGTGLAILTKYPILSREILHPGGFQSAALVAEISLPAQVTVVALHPRSPTSPEWILERDGYLRALGEDLADRSGHLIVAGDFNTTPWSYAFDLLAAPPGLNRSSLIPLGTWPAPYHRLGVPIDHILTSNGVGFLQYDVGPDLGSDHMPVTAVIRVPNQ